MKKFLLLAIVALLVTPTAIAASKASANPLNFAALIRPNGKAFDVTMLVKSIDGSQLPLTEAGIRPCFGGTTPEFVVVGGHTRHLDGRSESLTTNNSGFLVWTLRNVAHRTLSFKLAITSSGKGGIGAFCFDTYGEIPSTGQIIATRYWISLK